ncbi:uncharacterized protein LOC132704883 isoform X1 [Cylas formicarius]|uniref:uncharacterized protein LOC132704883 isoform X1 n=1 Tax=Cylas formicarius TaxID=197179 RepID=UPI002958553E|nr:uncharacterized protein LOC132704883 isoform X1 [Cylas formicarius]
MIRAVLMVFGVLHCVVSIPPPSFDWVYKKFPVPFENANIKETATQISVTQSSETSRLLGNPFAKYDWHDEHTKNTGSGDRSLTEPSSILFGNLGVDSQTTEPIQESIVTEAFHDSNKSTPEITFFHLTNVKSNSDCLKDPNGKCRDEYN